MTRNLYMVYWQDSARERQGGHVLVSVNPDLHSNPKLYAVTVALEKVQAICPGAQFFKLEHFPDTQEGVLWINEYID